KPPSPSRGRCALATCTSASTGRCPASARPTPRPPSPWSGSADRSALCNSWSRDSGSRFLWTLELRIRRCDIADTLTTPLHPPEVDVDHTGAARRERTMRTATGIALGAIVAVLGVCGARWMYASGMSRDAWIYYGYFQDLPIYLRRFSDLYYSSRLGMTLPGYL